MLALPSSLRQHPAAQGAWVPITLGCSGDQVFRLQGADGQRRFLKIGLRARGRSLDPEARRLAWLAGMVSVPHVLAFEHDAERDFLLMSAVPGLDATAREHGRDLSRLVELLGVGLRQLHALPVEGCPFDHRLAAELGRAQVRMEEGRVDEADFCDERRGRLAREVFDELIAMRPHCEDLVFTHGDPSLPNILLAAGRVSGFVDMGSAGVGDRYRDLALAARSLAYNWGKRWVPLFFDAYGLTAPDAEKLAYYRLLDEFF